MDQGLRTIPEHLPPDLSTFDVLYQGQGDFLLIALLCGLSVLLMLLWLLAVWEYLRRTNTSSFEPTIKEKLSWER